MVTAATANRDLRPVMNLRGTGCPPQPRGWARCGSVVASTPTTACSAILVAQQPLPVASRLPEVGILSDDLIPAVAIGASVLTTYMALTQQRRSESDRRVWEKRSSLYVDLLTRQDGFLLADPYDDPRDWWDVSAAGRSDEQKELARSLRARVDAFASEQVRDLWLKSARADNAVEQWASAWSEVQDPSLPPEMRAMEEVDRRRVGPYIEARQIAQESLRQRIREELAVARRSRRAWARSR